jgi:hypothetical protein
MRGEDHLLLDMPASLADKVAGLGAPVEQFTYGGQWPQVTFGFAIMATMAILIGAASGELGFGLVLGGIPGLLWLRTTLIVLQHRRFRLVVYTGGLVVWQHGQGGAYSWKEIRTVEQRATIPFRVASMAPIANIAALVCRGHTRTLVLGLADGEGIQFTNSLPRFNALWEIIRDATLSCLLPGVLKAVQAGQTVHFGELGVSREGLNDGHETLPWAEIRRVAVDEDTVTVLRVDAWRPWLKTSSSGFPNLHVLQGLMAAVLSNRPRR